MTKEALLARIQELSAIRDGHLGQANAAQGVIQECGFWIDQMEQARKLEEPEPEPQVQGTDHGVA